MEIRTVKWFLNASTYVDGVQYAYIYTENSLDRQTLSQPSRTKGIASHFNRQMKARSLLQEERPCYHNDRRKESKVVSPTKTSMKSLIHVDWGVSYWPLNLLYFWR